MPSSRPRNKAQDGRLLGEVLKGVSRSFYLSIRVLPSGMREPVAVAYLLARAADTIADTRALPPCQRLESLLSFRAQVEGPARPDVIEGIVARLQGRGDGVSPSETALMGSLLRVFELFGSLPDGDREQVRRVVVTLTRGMELDLTTFPAEDSGQVAALESRGDLDRYTYLVAGCVGEFWTLVATAHEPRMARWNAGDMSELGVRFGKALQLTNVLRDVPRDLRNGRCYLPNEDLDRAGLGPRCLLEPDNSPEAFQVLRPWIQTALEHFEAAEAYLLAVPRRCLRLRLAALWPILLGLATLAILARNDRWLDPARPSRVRRRWVYWMMARSVLAAPSDVLLRFWIRNLRGKVEKALNGS